MAAYTLDPGPFVYWPDYLKFNGSYYTEFPPGLTVTVERWTGTQWLPGLG